MSPLLESTDVRNKLEDLSGITFEAGQNPYEALIKVCSGNPAEIQALYSAHRTKRNGQQKAKFLTPDFKELIIDPFLFRLENKKLHPGFEDPRNCLVFWARPPDHVIKLASHLQQRLKEAAPNLWLMPTHRMHMTTLELTHSRTPEEIASLVSELRPTIPALVNLPYTNRSRLVKPMLSYDLTALAISFLPAAGEAWVTPEAVETQTDGSGADAYTYHHLRRDTFDLAKSTGVPVDSRYVVPSAHITLARYLTQDDHNTPEMREIWVRTIDDLNKWLEVEVWDRMDGELVGEWVVGQERGLDARHGTLWYGGGKTIMTGEGF